MRFICWTTRTPAPGWRRTNSPTSSSSAHLADERRRASLLGEVREAVFGAQDGLVSTLAVVSAVAGAGTGRFGVLVAGIAAGLAGIFSMAAGEYLSSKSQREIFEAQIVEERREVHERPGEAEAEMAFMLAADGLPRDEAASVARAMAEHPEVLLKTMVEKELGLAIEPDEGSPFQGALVMGGAFGLGAAVPIIPHLFLASGTAVVVVHPRHAHRAVRDRGGEEPLDASVLVVVGGGDPGDRCGCRRCRLLLRLDPANAARSARGRLICVRSPRRPSPARAPPRPPRTTMRRSWPRSNPATAGSSPPKVPRSPMTMSASATRMVGMRGAKFIRRPIGQMPGSSEPATSSASPARRKSQPTSVVTSMVVPR